jgi:hypothetical protein
VFLTPATWPAYRGCTTVLTATSSGIVEFSLRDFLYRLLNCILRMFMFFWNQISQPYKTNMKVNATVMVAGMKSTHFQECRWKDKKGKVVSCPRHEGIQGAAEVQLHSPLTSARRRGWVRSPPAQDRTPVLCTRGSLGTGTGMAVRAERKVSCKPYRNPIT